MVRTLFENILILCTLAIDALVFLGFNYILSYHLNVCKQFWLLYSLVESGDIS